MKVLFIGGTGNISTACTRLALDKGIELSLFTRGLSPRFAPEGARIISGDIRDTHQAAQLKDLDFDTVVDWVAYTLEDVERDLSLFRGRIRQYIFISSASAYRKPPLHYLISESTPIANPFWQYARDKIACEERLNRAFREEGFPACVVRPSLTYGETWLPCAIGGHDYTLVDRMKRGKKAIVHGDGQSLWVMTHNSDFAKGIIGLFGNPRTLGEQYHITSDEVLSWDQIYRIIGRAAGVEPDLIHIPSDFVRLFDERIGAGLLGDKAYSVVFDNSKVKAAVPGFQATVSFEEGIKRCLDWFDSDPNRKAITAGTNQVMDRIIERYESAYAPDFSRSGPIRRDRFSI
ncbi:MAG TPA: SDR family oxidoreductase [Acidobacteriota bacterium]|nr:SDR family oxidoreductase [Acidobacteriota bacterium]